MDNQLTQEISFNDLVLKLYDWYKYLLSKWIVIVLAGLIGLALGFGYTLYKKPVYSAVTTFALEDANSGGSMGQVAGLASMIGLDIGGSGGSGVFQGENIIELYKSRTMIQQTLLSEQVFDNKKMLLIERYLRFNPLKPDPDNGITANGVDFRVRSEGKLSRTQNSILGQVVGQINKENLTVTKPDKKSTIIKVEFNSRDELFSKAFTDLIVANVNDFYVKTKTKKSYNNVMVLKHQSDSVRRMLNGAISGMAQAVDANPNPNLSRQVLRVPTQRRQIDAEANKAILVELVKNLELSKITLLKETPLIQVVDEPVLPLKKVAPGRVQSMVLGAFLMGFLTVVFLLVRRGLNHIIG
jgi:uncharacterized protein involved in exopolysaccharide biosynthesis